MVKGTIINKFRGDVDILKPGLDMLEELTHVPVLGVVPMMDVDLDDEDSLSDQLRRTGGRRAPWMWRWSACPASPILPISTPGPPPGGGAAVCQQSL